MFQRRPTQPPDAPAATRGARARAAGGRAEDAAAGLRVASVLHRFRRTGVRRSVALLSLALLSSSFETLIPDVHDGDASATAVTRALEAAPHASGVSVVAPGVAPVMPGAAALEAPSHAPQSGVPAGLPAPAHPVYVCHVAHDHVVSAFACATDATWVASATPLTVPTYAGRLVNRSAAPPVRPPIA